MKEKGKMLMKSTKNTPDKYLMAIFFKSLTFAVPSSEWYDFKKLMTIAARNTNSK